MYTILLCAALGAVIVLFSAMVLKLAWWWSLIVGLIIATAAFVLTSRIIMKKLWQSWSRQQKICRGNALKRRYAV